MKEYLCLSENTELQGFAEKESENEIFVVKK